MKSKSIIYIFHCPNFFEIISLNLKLALEKLGFKCQLARDVKKRHEMLWVLFVARYDLILDKLPLNYIVYQTEPLIGQYPTEHTYIQFLRGATQIWEYSQSNMDFLRSIHKSVFYVPFRYTSYLETWNEPTEPYNVFNVHANDDPQQPICFLGHKTDYRQKVIQQLRQRGININWPDGVFGQSREQLLKSYAIHLVLPSQEHYKDCPQDISRIFPLGAKRHFMISQTIGECPIKSLVQCSIEHMVDQIVLYATHPTWRYRQIELVYQEIKMLHMSDQLKQTGIIQLLNNI